MGANFTPTFGAYSPLTPFRYWCQKVLPLTYDDSLSYYELLNKVVDYLNKTMEDVETLYEDVDAMLAAFNALQTYVNTYFDELDLTEEVQTVLDRMAENGSLDELLAPLVDERIGGVVADQIDDAVAGQIYNTVASQINAVVAEELPEAIGDEVSDWLENNITPGSGYAIDASLSVQNAAADSKVVGKGLGYTMAEWASGCYKTGSVGSVVDISARDSVSGRVSTKIEVSPGDLIHVAIGTGSASYRGYCFYDEDSTVLMVKLTNDGWEGVLHAPENAKWLVLNTLVSETWPFHYAFKGKTTKDLEGEFNEAISATNAEIEEIDESKQDNLTFDTTPLDDSNNPVTSDGIYEDALEIRNAIGWNEETVYVYNVSGHYWNDEGDTAVLMDVSTYRAYDPVSVLEGEYWWVRINGASSNRQSPILLTDDNLTIIKRYKFLGLRETTIKVPHGVTKILLTCAMSTLGTVKKLELKQPKELVSSDFNFKGKNIAIIGDSISTDGNWSAENPTGNMPEIIIQDADVGVALSAYVTWWDVYNNDEGTSLTNKTIGGHTFTAEEIGTEVTFTPIADDIGKFVGKPRNNNTGITTWWEILAEKMGFNPINVSWSGASVTSHEGDKPLYKASYAWHESQIRKCGIRTPGTMTRTAPDMVIVFRGVNDFSHTPYVRITDDYFKNYPIGIPADDTTDDGYGIKEGLYITVNKLRQAYPYAIIVLCTPNFFKRVSYANYPVKNGFNSEEQFNQAIRECANYLNCPLIDFAKDGLNFYNASTTYYQDGAAFTHPTDKGHEIMSEKAYKDLLNQVNKAF